jgi:hypothetical protein
MCDDTTIFADHRTLAVHTESHYYYVTHAILRDVQRKTRLRKQQRALPLASQAELYHFVHVFKITANSLQSSPGKTLALRPRPRPAEPLPRPVLLLLLLLADPFSAAVSEAESPLANSSSS